MAESTLKHISATIASTAIHSASASFGSMKNVTTVNAAAQTAARLISRLSYQKPLNLIYTSIIIGSTMGLLLVCS